MTLADIKNRIYFYTNTDSSSFSAADMLMAINNAQDEVHTAILKSQDGWRFDDTSNTDFPIGYTDLVAEQADYSLPTGILKIHSVEVQYGGSWYKARPLNENEAAKSLEDHIFSADNPFYAIIGGSIILYPAPSTAGTEALKVVYDRNLSLFASDDLTTGTESPAFDRNFHDLIPLKCSFDWALANSSPKAGNFKATLDEMYFKLKQHYGDKQKDAKVVMTPNYYDVE